MIKPWNFATGHDPRSSEAGVWENLRLQEIHKSYNTILDQSVDPSCAQSYAVWLQSNTFANLLQCRNRSRESGSCRSWRRRSTPAQAEACSLQFFPIVLSRYKQREVEETNLRLEATSDCAHIILTSCIIHLCLVFRFL